MRRSMGAWRAIRSCATAGTAASTISPITIVLNIFSTINTFFRSGLAKKGRGRQQVIRRKRSEKSVLQLRLYKVSEKIWESGDI